MENNQNNQPTNECGIKFVAIFMLLVICAFFIYSCSESCRNLTNQQATNNDVTIETEQSATSITMIINPKENINNLRITIYYYNSKNILLGTEVRNIGDVSKKQEYRRTLNMTGLSVSEILTVSRCKFEVTGGTISIF